MTIDEMAEELGVSKSTISRALSGKGRISDATRERICSYALRNGYAPRGYNSRGLVKTKNLGFVLPADAYTMSIPFFQECLIGVSEAALQLDYNVLIATRTEHDISGIRALVEKNKVDGIILTRSMEDDRAVKYLTEMNFPIGLTGTSPGENVIQVDSDNRAAAESMTSMLIGSGYQRFAVILGMMSITVNRRRQDGIRTAWEKNGIAAERQLMYTEFVKMELWDNMIEEIMNRRVECIICGDDVICTMIISRLQAEGYRVPRDIAVASLYNSTNLDCFSPSITTVNVSARVMGNVIGKQMIHYLNGSPYQSRTYLDYEILFRKSTSAAHSGKTAAETAKGIL